MVARAIGEHRIPDGKRDAEESLPADTPVAGEAVNPVLQTGLHVRRVPLQLARTLHQRVSERHRLDEPLPARDDLERTIPFLVELHLMGDRPRLADEVAAVPQQLDDLRARLRGRQVRELIVRLLRTRGIG